MKIIKSRFGSSKCSICHETIDPGVKIARDANYSGKGGWAHAGCAVEAAKKKKKGRGVGGRRAAAAPAEGPPAGKRRKKMT